MKYKVRCTHIISQLRNVQKYANTPIEQKDGKCYIEVTSKIEATCIQEMEFEMSRALWWYETLIQETSK